MEINVKLFRMCFCNPNIRIMYITYSSAAIYHNCFFFSQLFTIENSPKKGHPLLTHCVLNLF